MLRVIIFEYRARYNRLMLMIFKALARVFFLLKGTFFSFVRKKIATFFLLLLISTAMECIGLAAAYHRAALGEIIIVRTDGTCSLANVDYERSTQRQDTRTKRHSTHKNERHECLPKAPVDRTNRHRQALLCRVRHKRRSEWTRRGSNPRPNGEIIRFLHAYLCHCFRATLSAEQLLRHLIL